MKGIKSCIRWLRRTGVRLMRSRGSSFPFSTVQFTRHTHNEGLLPKTVAVNASKMITLTKDLISNSSNAPGKVPRHLGDLCFRGLLPEMFSFSTLRVVAGTVLCFTLLYGIFLSKTFHNTREFSVSELLKTLTNVIFSPPSLRWKRKYRDSCR